VSRYDAAETVAMLLEGGGPGPIAPRLFDLQIQVASWRSMERFLANKPEDAMSLCEAAAVATCHNQRLQVELGEALEALETARREGEKLRIELAREKRRSARLHRRVDRLEARANVERTRRAGR